MVVSMKITPTCVPCLLNRILFEANLSSTDKDVQTQVIRKACSLLGSLYNPNTCSAEIATQVHKQTYELLHDSDPYKKLKQESNQIATSLLPIVKKRIKDSENPLKTAILASIVGNSLDFGIQGASKNPKELKQVFDQIFTEGFGYDDTSHFFSALQKSNSILYFTDNCGEIVFDRLVCEQIKKTYPHVLISVVVKGEPVLSDATLADAEQLHFDSTVDHVYTTGGFAVGVDLKDLPKKVKSLMHSSDLIVCKGMANYESLSETMFHPIVYLLRSKCQPIASSMNVPLDANIVKMYE